MQGMQVQTGLSSPYSPQLQGKVNGGERGEGRLSCSSIGACAKADQLPLQADS